MNANFIMRFKAFMLDYLLIFAYLVVLAIFNILIFPSVQSLFNGSLVLAQFTGFLMVTLPVSLYFIISDSVIGRQSFGKRRMGIKVVNERDETLPILHAIFRTILKFLPWELSHYLVYRLVYLGDGEVPLNYYIIGGIIYTLMFAYILTTLFTKRKRSLYDIVVRTQVIRV
ncbi:RDD family protein [Psychrobacillus psychrodurans]|uniref:RDD family protein n=1 Tax=Psychrobacillus psychrodurans TaxID=126157 RepID=A0A9X3LAG8_9BACI|nr:RDD family protein [Psychrobacillus psychrodurans]MCZ8534428.1 RDD family protein [Psychrobacillus psychrodurans]